MQILVRTGCDRTMVSASRVPPSKVDHSSMVPVLCVHGVPHSLCGIAVGTMAREVPRSGGPEPSMQ